MPDPSASTSVNPIDQIADHIHIGNPGAVVVGLLGVIMLLWAMIKLYDRSPD